MEVALEEEGFNVERNPHLLSARDVMHYEFFPTAPRDVWLLNATYLKPQQTVWLNKVLEQPAAQVRTVTNLGFVFRRPKPGAAHAVVKVNGKNGREIIGLDPEHTHSNDGWIKISREDLDQLKKCFPEDMFGRIRGLKHLDHRIPQEARRKYGIVPATLSPEDISSGSWFSDFQILSDTANYIKREACKKCMYGEEIPLPGILGIMRPYYKSTRDEDENGCVGCLWYDYLKPKNVKEMPASMRKALKENQVQMRVCVERAKQIEEA